MKKRRVTLVVLVGFIAFVSGGWLLQRGGAQGGAIQKARLFEQVLRFVAEYYVDSLDAGQLYDMAIDGMLDQLNDPYTSFLRRDAFGELSLSTTGNYGGVGLRIDLRDGWVTVVNPIADSPGERAGLESGDQIVEIEGTSTKGWDTQQAANVLRGEPGTPANITVVRAGFADSLHFTLTRAEIHVNSIEGAMMLTPDIGYLSLTTVSESAAAELQRSVDDLRKEGARHLILDLRNNPGGILTQGVALADLFIDRGEVVVETRGRAPGASEIYKTAHRQAWPDMPLVVLVNRGTASAAEILAGALQDHDRAVVLGTATFGKGVAYLLVPLTETEAVTVTSSRWYTPSGRSIQRRRFPAGAQPLLARGGPIRDESDSATTFRTMGGRELQTGGGGIQPDILVARDSLTEGEQRFAEALGSKIPDYRNVLSRYALELKGQNAVTDPNFAVSDAMLRTILARMVDRGVEMSAEEFFGARELIGDQFALELTRYVFGRDAELRRNILRDEQTRRAVELLEMADSPEKLVALAADLAKRNNN